LKAQDRLRKWFSKRGIPDGLQITCISLGDSDVDYEMSQQADQMNIIPAAYEIPRIKSKLIYSGSIANITGNVLCYVRKVDPNGNVASTYFYPPQLTFFNGVNVPILVRGYNWSSISFELTNPLREGNILFFSTVPDNYFDSNGNIARLVEQYDFTFTNLPTGWEVIIDDLNGSLFIAKPAGYTFITDVGLIKIKGRLTGLEKNITFNI
jgi:hypothetical protein